ncbi:arfaptin-2-like isoform X1 [Haliotis cracherodii]|uniref:arfaptin-2-like isoform X1 n=1 Tax=Haliotis rufescens TaxID=6454 RepID=UPI001EB043C4|nr:arfaptin-2-like isoform X1 [Haliotis rufescens]XP_046363104.1 arfaptin-2-like isoform X1 [Haliotis rufescens]
MAREGQQAIPNGMEGEEDTFERDLKEMLDDGPNLNDASSNVQGGTPTRMTASYAGSTALSSSFESPATRSASPQARLTRSYTMPPATSNVPLSSPQTNGDFVPKSITQAATKLESLREWSINTFKCTKQMLSERFGKSSKTVDLELEAQIEILRDTQRKYASVLRLARALTNHFFYVVQTQRALGESFSDLAQKAPELHEEFTYNCETQRSLVKNGETLLGALNFFTSSVNTLCNKTMEDTLLTVKLYETARLEFDAYRNDMETLSLGPKDSTTAQRLDESKRKFEDHKVKFERLRGDVSIKLKFLEENKVKVMHKQLLLFHNAVSAYFSGNEAMLDTTLKQFNIKLKRPNAEKPSWIEQ